MSFADRTLRTHAKQITDMIIQLAGEDNTRKQVQLAVAVAHRLNVQKITEDAEAREVQLGLFYSIKEFYEDIQDKNPGRFVNLDRAAHMTTNAIVGHQAYEGPKVSGRAKERQLGIKRDSLYEGADRYIDWFLDKSTCLDGDREYLFALRGKIRADKWADEWLEFIVGDEGWLSEECTRAGEGSADYCKNPKNWKDGTQYRIHWIEKQMQTIVGIIQKKGEKKFPPDYAYADGRARVFKVDSSHGKYVLGLKPFQCKPRGRDLCLCWRCLRWSFATAGLYNWRKEYQTSKIINSPCKCENIRNPYELMKSMACPLAEDEEYHKDECLSGTCGDCGDFKKSPFCGECRQVKSSIRYMKRQKIARTSKRGVVKEVHDFEKAEVTAAEFEERLREIWTGKKKKEGGGFSKTEEGHLDHHTDLKCQSRDWHRTQTHFPRRSMASVQDFSENLTIEVKLEHQSKYYSQLGVTLYGKVCFFHVEDIRDSYMSRKDKDEFIEMCGREGLNHIVAVTLCAVSDDLRHNPAFVQHVNDKVFLPLIKSVILIEAPENDYFRCDGSPTQFDNATQYVWVSRSQAETGVRTDLTLHCTCHGKDKCDPEMGAAKTIVKKVLLTENVENATDVRIYDYKGVADTLVKEGYETPKDSILKKKGRGIYKRHVLAISAADVNQNIPRGKTVKGSKVCRQFTCVNDPMSVRIRRRACHECGGCLRLDPEGRIALLLSLLSTHKLSFCSYPCYLYQSVYQSASLVIQTRLLLVVHAREQSCVAHSQKLLVLSWICKRRLE